MVKEKKGTDTAEPSDPVPAGAEVMDVRLRGPADKVRQQLGIDRDRGNGDKPERTEPPAEIDEKFFALLQNPKYQVVVKRTLPRFVGDVKADVQVAEFDLPTTWKDIADEIEKSCGGHKYRVAIVNPGTGETLAAQRLKIDAEPIVGLPPDAKDFIEGLGGDADEPSPLDNIDKFLDKDLKAQTKQLEIEAAKRRIAEMRGDPARPKPDVARDPKTDALERQIADLQRQREEDRRRDELKAIEDRHKRDMDELKALISSNSKPKEDPLIKLLIDQQKSSDDKFSKVMEQMNNQKLDTMMSELRELRSKREDSGFEKQLEMFKMFADIAGIDLPGRGGGGDDDEDKEWYEILIEKHLPRVLDMIENKKKGGGSVTKEDLIKEIDKAADRAGAEAAAAIRARQETAGRLPAPPPPARPPAPSAQVPLPPPDSSAAPLPPQAPPGPSIPKPTIPSVEEERSARCAGVLAVLEREAMFRPKLVQWNYSAWQNLPDDVLERFSTAPDLASALAVFDGVVNADLLAKLKERVSSDDRTRAWSAKSYRELQGWWAEAAKDPDFDPEAEPEDEVVDGDAGDEK